MADKRLFVADFAYEGGLSVGSSPGLGLDAGSVNFGAANTCPAEIGDTLAATKEQRLKR